MGRVLDPCGNKGTRTLLLFPKSCPYLAFQWQQSPHPPRGFQRSRHMIYTKCSSTLNAARSGPSVLKVLVHISPVWPGINLTWWAWMMHQYQPLLLVQFIRGAPHPYVSLTPGTLSGSVGQHCSLNLSHCCLPQSTPDWRQSLIQARRSTLSDQYNLLSADTPSRLPFPP